MERTLAVLALLAASITPAHASIWAPTCKTIATNPAITKGILLNCLDGKGKFIFQSIRGPAILNVWGSWCFPCREEIPYLVQIAKTKKVQIIGIDASESKDAAGMAFVKAHDMTWPQLSDIKNKTKGIFGLGVPVSRFIDVDGKVVYEKIGPFKSVDEIKKAAKEFLGIKF
jgi:cytochrome c biogenesis protein CcmG/thiol:disulfide interchange protein DsbE